ncbi:FAD-binding oxidoreductase, partial [Methylobacterium sp. WL18]
MSSATLVTEPIVFRWHQAEITAIAPVTPQVKSFRLRCAIAQAYRAGQHVDVRLTAEDGYQAQRSYSIASAPDGSGTLELMVEALPDGEVSGWFSEAAEVGDRVELRGPIGGSFSWDGPDG